MSVNRLILGDNLEILKSMEADSVDLGYVRLLSNSLFLLIIAYYVLEGTVRLEASEFDLGVDNKRVGGGWNSGIQNWHTVEE
jgi:hypothetical protein